MKIDTLVNLIKDAFEEEIPAGVEPLLAFTSHIVKSGHLLAVTPEGRLFLIGESTRNFSVGFRPENQGSLGFIEKRNPMEPTAHQPILVVPLDPNPNCNKKILVIPVIPTLDRFQQWREDTVVRIMNFKGRCIWAGWKNSKSIPETPRGGWVECKPSGDDTWFREVPSGQFPLGGMILDDLDNFLLTGASSGAPPDEDKDIPSIHEEPNVVSMPNPPKKTGRKKA